jgi:hypothetical protein
VRWDAVAALALCAGIVAAWTFARVAVRATPVDAALPSIVAALSLVAWLVRDSGWFVAIECALPLLIGCSMTIEDDRLRLIGFGAIAACTFCGALLAAGEMTPWRAAGFVVAGVALLRWIARDRFEIGRETLIVGGCILVALALDQRTWGIAAAMVVALAAPAIPAKTAAIPLFVALALWAGSWILRGRADRLLQAFAVADAIPLLAIAATLLLFPWSGVAARTLPYFWRVAPRGERVTLNYALAPGQSVDIDLPQGSRALIVSAANALQMSPGTLVGRIDGRIAIRFGDIADWGYARRDQYWRSANMLPRVPAGTIHGYGYDAWIDGAGRIALQPRLESIRVTAETSLPSSARLQVEAIETELR